MSFWTNLTGGAVNNTTIVNNSALTAGTTSGYLKVASSSYTYGYGLGTATINADFYEESAKSIFQKVSPIISYINSNPKDISLISDTYFKIVDMAPTDNSFEKCLEQNKIIFELLNNGEATWLMYTRHDNKFISHFSTLLIQHIKE